MANITTKMAKLSRTICVKGCGKRFSERRNANVKTKNTSEFRILSSEDEE
jgi:hypothetical protein